jgi:hypothetical protein
MSDFAIEHLPERGIETTGLYGDGEPMVVNTYNHENLLSQVLQYVYFETDDNSYVILSIHGGCDVRGGYTRPRVFELNDSDGASILLDSDATIYCTNRGRHADLLKPGRMIDDCGAYWHTDDGSHWYRDGSCGSGAGTQLEEYDVVEIEETLGDSAPVEHRGKLVVDDTGAMYCPCCGSRLQA